MRLTDKQLAMRRTGLTASDMTVLAGVSPYGRTAHDVYLDKCGRSEFVEPSDAQEFGHDVEPIALRRLQKELGLSVVPCEETARHPTIKIVLATPDGYVMNDNARCALGEAKAVGFRMAHRWGESGDPDAVPDEVIVQTQWQMTCTQIQVCHVVALLGTEFRFYRREHDEDLSAALLDMGQKFWADHVSVKKPPAFDGSEGAARMVRQLFKRNTKGLIAAPVEAFALVDRFFAAKARAIDAEASLSKAQTELCALIGDHEGIQSPDWVATWKQREGSPDWKAIAQKLGATKELAEEFRRDGPRVLNVKLRKDKAA